MYCIQVPEITPSYTVDMAAFALASVGESVNQWISVHEENVAEPVDQDP